MFTSLKNRKIGTYIWLISIPSLAGFFLLLGLVYYHFQSQNQLIKNLTNQIESQAKLNPSQSGLLTDVTTEQTKSLENIYFMLKVLTLIEIGCIFWSVSAMISGVTKRVEQMAGEMAASAANITQNIQAQEGMAMEQASSVNETTATIDELGASARQTAQQTEGVAAAARRALDLAEIGMKAVDKTLAEMSTLNTTVSAIAEKTARLSQQISQIRNISSLVGDLASQTNMLALNAAVEAVRAGEHGKGFAVVASEIRKLADQSQKSTERISILVADIQTAINSTVLVTEKGTNTVATTVKIAEDTAGAFQGVTSAIDNITVSTEQISLSANQQAIAIGQVANAMNDLNGLALQTAKAIVEVKASTEQLNSLAQYMKTIA
ncbi:MAG TPA: chemotaxis protein [Oscillatoriaceae cyanobacterium M33_DOE_052]|uniref:Chemotaxis protein n=1 Tax=Planktothricoides sp. SpSt-374 TaxID=2282167 RepID=A0A7C3ZK54_9CYAN|nr:chemotaxis protein [Oscillatoriaceae cyanobacterium M33_DOE_052]